MPDLFVCRNAGDNAPHRKRPEHKDGLCWSCWNDRRKRRRHQGRVSSVRRTFGWDEHELGALRDAQRGPDGRVRCPCGRAIDRKKEPAMDHSHRLEAAGVPIRYTVRALLCQPCNVFIGRLGDRPEALIALAKVLVEFPAQDVLRKLDET